MEVYIDHYLVLGLPSGEKGTKISYKDITKAYKRKALELHPDKKPNDPNAVTNFQNLQASYEILKDENTRKKFDADLIRRVKQRNTSNNYDMRTRWSDMYDQERQRAAFEKRERKRAAAAAFEEQERKRAAAAAAFEKRERKRAAAAAAYEERKRKRAAAAAAAYEERKRKQAAADALKANFYDAIRLKAEKEVYDRFGLKRRGVDKENVLKVFWAKGGSYYCEKRLKEIFEKFGEVEDVIMSYVYKGSALIVMATKDGVAAAVEPGTVCGDRLNPLLVRPLRQLV